MHELQDTYGTPRTRRAINPQFMVGALVGAGLALLLAPAKGKDTRKKVGVAAQKLGENAKNVVGRTRHFVEGIKQDAQSAMKSGRDEFVRNQRSRDSGAAWTA
ncbi:MAG TPA: YtxH domain-containing protein [Candidatus Eisenbacteria bacterium]|jgi:gas vesicle protein|nr:YtxH domain-containing protein [Candidatus Eisenbacteria bacterium]